MANPASPASDGRVPSTSSPCDDSQFSHAPRSRPRVLMRAFPIKIFLRAARPTHTVGTNQLPVAELNSLSCDALCCF